MKNDEIKEANRKALPKFLLFAVVCAIVGGVIGYYSGYGAAKGGMDELVGMMKETGAFFGTHIAPWLMVAIAIIVPVLCLPIYRSAKKLLAAWDGEDEAISDTIDRKLSVVIWIASASFIVAYFLIAASYLGGFAIFDDMEKTIVFFIGIVSFFAIMIEAILFQQKCVDTTKQMNPEKKASVYDMVLAIVLAVCALVFDIGFLPSFTVCLIWAVNISMYCKEAMRYSEAGNRIS